jgi:nucleotidyltransferase substrate binding protein (TIGR01987 family)
MESRWKLRFIHYEKAYKRLADALKRKKYDDLEQAGLIQTFEFTFELGWKTLKDLLIAEGFDAKTPRQTIKEAFRAEYIKDGQLWLEALEKRNLMAHIYDETESKAAIKLIKDKYFYILEDLYLFLKKTVQQ